MRLESKWGILGATFGFVAGFLADLGGKIIFERTTPTENLVVSIANIDFGYRKISLEEWDTPLTPPQIRKIVDEKAPSDSIFLSAQFVKEFNLIGKQSSIIGQFVSRRYSGEEFFSQIANPLGFYGDYAAYIEVTKAWIDDLKSQRDTDKGKFKDFVHGKMAEYLQGAGIFNSITASFLRGDFPLEASEPCQGPSLGIVEEKRDRGERIEFHFGNWGIPMGFHFGDEIGSRRIINNIHDVFDRGCRDIFIKLLEIANRKFQKERRLVEEMTQKVNTYFEIATPETINLTAIVINKGRFGSVVSADARIIFGADSIVPIELKAVKSSTGRFSHRIPSRDVREITFTANLPKARAARIANVFRGGAQEVRLALDAISDSGKKEIFSLGQAFSN